MTKEILNMELAYSIAKYSKAKRKKVGSVIFDKRGRVVGTGFNGTPSGTDNTCEDENNNTYEHVIHAELNAIVNSRINDMSDCEIYVTYSPCIKCAAIIVQKQIKRVYYNEPYRDLSGINFLINNGVEVIQVNMENQELTFK